ncbi:MFS transporter [Amycolatopsis sp. DG1A-15b]|uniref:MFS transporter n=1 Tax=Amycolatopsis sp. DG1A-15b TaxID=3052846 RepID=UPI00255C0377|nr:MFS transporter [Amycolatopsis sp. DG1A-15b]WIX89860.1 MFS transporter [Amycolatopsis sp. DG1A-15b]
MSGLTRYLTAAVLARGADSGASVGLLLLVADRHQSAATGGLLIAALTAPHLVGPWLAVHLDRARDRRRLLALAYLVYGVALTAGALATGRLPTAAALAAVAVAGACGPLLTGGLSSVLDDLGPGRRGRGWDALTYGVGGTAGPAAAATLTAVAGPLEAVLALAGTAVAAGALVVTLPLAGRARPAEAASLRAGLAVLVRRGPLRRVTLLTVLAAVELGALPVVAVRFGAELRGTAAAGATLTVVYGAGSLLGSALVTAWPLRGEPEVLTARLFAAMAVATAMSAFAPAYAVAIAGFAVLGLLNAMAFTATLSARGAYAPASAQAQVFVTSAGLKVTSAAAGAALAGAASGLGGQALLLAAATTTGLAVVAAWADGKLAPAFAPTH